MGDIPHRSTNSPTIYLNQKEYDSLPQRDIFRINRLVVDDVVIRDRDGSTGMRDDGRKIPSKRMTSLAERCWLGSGADRRLDYLIELHTCGSAIHEDWLENNPKSAKPFTSDYTHALSLGKHVPWLAPIANWVERSVILVNGLGLPVGGKDYRVVHDDMPRAFCSAWLSAIAEKLRQEESRKDNVHE